MNSIQISLTAKNYADALVQMGRDGVMAFDDILKNIDSVREICKTSKDLSDVLKNPTISDDVKYSIIDEVFKQDINEKIIDFIKVLIEKKRFGELDGICEAYRDELDKINNLQRVSVTSAVELNGDMKQRIIDKLQNRLSKTVTAEWLIDREIIGGIVVKINDDVIDSSLKNKLENLSKNLI